MTVLHMSLTVLCMALTVLCKALTVSYMALTVLHMALTVLYVPYSYVVGGSDGTRDLDLVDRCFPLSALPLSREEGKTQTLLMTLA